MGNVLTHIQEYYIISNTKTLSFQCFIISEHQLATENARNQISISIVFKPEKKKKNSFLQDSVFKSS